MRTVSLPPRAPCFALEVRNQLLQVAHAYAGVEPVEGVGPNASRAVRHYAVAAERGDLVASFNLAHIVQAQPALAQTAGASSAAVRDAQGPRAQTEAQNAARPTESTTSATREGHTNSSQRERRPLTAKVNEKEENPMFLKT